MTYATGRRYLDADSHLMELPGWLEPYADPDIRDASGRSRSAAPAALADDAVAAAQRRRDDPTGPGFAEADLMGKKGLARRRRVRPGRAGPPRWTGSGSTPSWCSRRSRPRSTSATTSTSRSAARARTTGPSPTSARPTTACSPSRSSRGGRRSWCCAPSRRRSTPGAGRCTCRAKPARREVGPTHPDHDAMWATLADRAVPFVVHVGGAGRLVPREFHDNGIPVTDFLGGEREHPRQDYMAISHLPEVFLASLVFDGVFERFPALRGRLHRAGRDVAGAVAPAPRPRAGVVRPQRGRPP